MSVYLIISFSFVLRTETRRIGEKGIVQQMARSEQQSRVGRMRHSGLPRFHRLFVAALLTLSPS